MEEPSKGDKRGRSLSADCSSYLQQFRQNKKAEKRKIKFKTPEQTSTTSQQPPYSTPDERLPSVRGATEKPSKIVIHSESTALLLGVSPSLSLGVRRNSNNHEQQQQQQTPKRQLPQQSVIDTNALRRIAQDSSQIDFLSPVPPPRRQQLQTNKHNFKDDISLPPITSQLPPIATQPQPPQLQQIPEIQKVKRKKQVQQPQWQ